MKQPIHFKRSFMSVRTFLYLLFLILISPKAYSQGLCAERISGQALNEIGRPFEGVEIIIESLGVGAVTDSLGNFAIKGLCVGTYNVEFRHVGYRTIREARATNSRDRWVLVMEPESKNLKEIVVHEENHHLEGIQNYALLNDKQLSESAGKSLGETLKELPGVSTIQTGPGIFKPVIHGLHSQRVLILNHGIRQEGQQWGAEHAPEIDPLIASNIVVVKDASAIKYGTDALGGVIIVNPAPLPEQPGIGGSIQTIAQSNGRMGTISGLLEGGVKKFEGWGWRLQSTAKRGGDFHAPDYSLTNTGIRELAFSAATGFHGEKIGADVFFSHFQTELGILRGSAISNLDDLAAAMEQEPPQGTTDFSYVISPPRQEVSHNLLKLNTHWARAQGEWRLQYGYQSNFRKEYDLRIGGLSSIPAIDLQLKTHTLELEWEKTGSRGIGTSFGLNGMYQENRNVQGTQRLPFIPDFNSFSGGPFAVAKIALSHWTLDLGARFDFRNFSVAGFDFKNTRYDAELTFSNMSASLGASRSLDQKNNIKINLSSAWRPPHVAELYSLGTHQSAAAIEYGLLLNDVTNEVMNINNVPFKVEQAWKSVFTHQYASRRFQLETTVYANFVLNYIYLRPMGVTQSIRGVYPYFRYTQTDALFIGADISAVWHPTNRFRVSPGISYLSASDFRNSDFLVFIPPNRFEIAIRYEGLRNKFYLETKMKYVAMQYRAPRVVTVRGINDAVAAGQDPLGGRQANFDFMAAPDGYFLAGVATGISVPAWNGRFDFRLAIENMMNTSYRDYTNRFRYYSHDLGRNMILSAKFIF